MICWPGHATTTGGLSEGNARLVFFTNSTTAINMVARSLHLEAGDEILATDHEYGAMDRTWRFNCLQTGARYVNKHIPLPLDDRQTWVDAFWQGVTPNTRVIFLSHITSPTALILPVAEICRRAREAGIISVIDGAHAPSQILLDLSKIGADLYAGACRKWLCARRSRFLYARKEVQKWLDPLVVSWGYECDTPSGSQFIDYHQWQGTRDLSAFLSVPAAIDFQAERDWEAVRQNCHRLCSQTRSQLNYLTGQVPLCPDSSAWFSQMFAVTLPPETEVEPIKRRLYENYRIEVPVYMWREQPVMRVSFQAYNDTGDSDALLDALADLLQT
jgi:isopenicillin-N epimerase